MKLSRAVAQYLAHCKHVKNLSHHSIKAYTIDLSEFVQHIGGKKSLKNVGRELIRSYVQHLFEARGLKETSVKRKIACVKSMYRWYESEETITQNPFRVMDLKIKLPKQLPKALSKKEIKALLKSPLKQMGYTHRDAYKSEEFRQRVTSRNGFSLLTTQLVIELLFATGVRVGELVSIQESDISNSDKTIKIKGKGNRERVVFLPDQPLITLIDTYISARSNFNPKTKTMLINTRGTALDTQMVRLLIRRTGDHAKINRRITPHMLRHSAATHLLDSGVDIRHVQKLLGHHSITTTQLYTHVSDAQLKSVICKSHPMGRLLGG